MNIMYFCCPEGNNMNYNLRPRCHDRQLLIRKSVYVNNSLFIVGMLHNDSYRLCCFSLFYLM